MANLIIDQGNTLLKVAVFQNGKVLQKADFQEFDQVKIFENFDLSGVERGIFASVNRYTEVTFGEFPFPVYHLSANLRLPFVNKYATPQTLGADRIALAAAAVTNFPDRDCLVVDAGTCITYDFVERDGSYLGGAISPGLKMRLKALHHFTARLPLVGLKDREAVGLIGDSTENSILSGVVHGTLNEVTGTIERYRERFPSMITVITGGDTSVFAYLAKNDIFAQPEFLLLGLNNILDYHAESL